MELQFLLELNFCGADPGEGGHVGDGVAIVDEEIPALEAALDHAQQAYGFVAVALDRVRMVALVFGEFVEVAELPEYGPDARHLEHEPLHRLPLVARVRRHELPGFLRQVQQDGAALEDSDRFPICTEIRVKTQLSGLYTGSLDQFTGK